MNKDEVLKLAKLARIEVSDAEALSLTHEFASILEYVGQVKDVAGGSNLKSPISDLPITNIMREDRDPHEGGIFTDEILANAPESKDGYIKVKQILG